MKISKSLQEFITQKDIQKLIDDNDFDSIYAQMYKKRGIDVLQEFTEVLNKIGINPLDYMSYIPYGFFMDNKNLIKYVVKPNIKRVSANAFTDCTNLKIIYIPESVKQLSLNAFSGCENLTEIFYDGTKEKFIEISPYHDIINLFAPRKAIPEEMKIYCTNGIIEKVFK